MTTAVLLLSANKRKIWIKKYRKRIPVEPATQAICIRRQIKVGSGHEQQAAG